MDAEFKVLLERIDNGFVSVGDRLDVLKNDFNLHRVHCLERFSGIEKAMAVDAAVDKTKGCMEKERLDWWKWIIRGIIGVIGFQSFLSLWGVFWRVLGSGR